MAEMVRSWERVTELEGGMEWLLNLSAGERHWTAVIGMRSVEVVAHKGEQNGKFNAASLGSVLTEMVIGKCNAERVRDVTQNTLATLTEQLKERMQDVFRHSLTRPSCTGYKSSDLMREVLCADGGPQSHPLSVRTDTNDDAEGAPSSGSHASNDFMNSSFMFHQFDCRSDCTDSTGPDAGAGPNPLGTTLGFPRRRFRSADTTSTDVSVNDTNGWDANSSMFNTLARPTSQSYLLPTPPLSPCAESADGGSSAAQDSAWRDVSSAAGEGGDRSYMASASDVDQSHSSSAATVSNMLLGEGQARNRVDGLYGLSVPQRPSAILAVDSDDSGDGEGGIAYERGGVVAGRGLQPVLPPQVAAVPQPDTQHQTHETASQQERRPADSPDRAGEGESEAPILDVLVLPTLLPASVREVVHGALGGLSVEVRREYR
jgi:hypothetical protein